MTETYCRPAPTTVRLVMREFEADVVVAAKQRVAEDVVALELREVGGHPLPAWEPGAHIDLIMSSGLIRQYSLCGDPADRQVWRVAVLREPADRTRGGSPYVHDTIDTGTDLRIRGPRNHFQLIPAKKYLFIAGGIGITPILSMIDHAESSGSDWQLIYGGRSLESMAFVDDLSRYGDRVDFWPQDQRGLIDLDRFLGTARADTLVYSCGPQSLLTAVEERCANWPTGSLHVERFSTGALDEESVENKPIEVVLAQQGLTVTVPADQSVLEAIEQQNVTVYSSCRAGMCGTCETPVLEGVPDHRDDVLTHEERAANDCMMICVSRSRGAKLVLDI